MGWNWERNETAALVPLFLSFNFLLFNGLYGRVRFGGGRPRRRGRCVEEAHAVAADVVGDVDVGAHGGVFAVAGPFHHNGGGDAQGEGVDDEGAPGTVGRQHLVLGECLVDALWAEVLGEGDGRVNAGRSADLLQAAVDGVERFFSDILKILAVFFFFLVYIFKFLSEFS